MSKNFIIQSITVPSTAAALATTSVLFKGCLITPESCDIKAAATAHTWLNTAGNFTAVTAGSDVALPSNFAWDISAGDLQTLTLKSASGQTITLIGEEVEHGYRLYA